MKISHATTVYRGVEIVVFHENRAKDREMDTEMMYVARGRALKNGDVHFETKISAVWAIENAKRQVDLILK